MVQNNGLADFWEMPHLQLSIYLLRPIKSWTIAVEDFELPSVTYKMRPSFAVRTLLVLGAFLQKKKKEVFIFCVNTMFSI